MTTVSVLVPWRADGADRDAGWRYARQWWETTYPGWQVITGACPDGPWVKALAVGHALAAATGDTLVVADADVLVPGVARAVARVQAGTAAWAMPHERVYRLGRSASQDLYAGGALPSISARARPAGVYDAYKGVDGGGCVVLSRALYERVPLDPRFAGWGQEDQSWARALEVMAGPGWRAVDPLWHLWHPPAQREARGIGTPAGAALFRRYRATGNPDAMTALLDEFRSVAESGDHRGAACDAPA